ncbi:probable cytochrome P450 6d5 [Drosophila nasuta]|uniref:probable cytochrome P450 6d5 n=1 Tax=Drosophila nasuta TaxID=42062 RepID=UPI00295F3663|nr:probable cytochrome P450 6d5 [Drosophila nasuta]
MFFVLFLLTAVALLYVYLKWNFSFWDRKGFISIQAAIPFGVLDSVRRNKRSFGLAIYDAYNATTERFVGIYLTLRPALLVRDAELARDMLVKDFASFHDRGIYIDEVHDPMSASIFAMEGSKWRATRTKLTPSFTSGKLKGMFPTAEACSEKLLAYLNKKLPDTSAGEVDMKSIMASYAIDIVASTIFGLDVDSFTDPNNEFRQISKEANAPTIKNIIRGATSFLYPGVEKIFNRLGSAIDGQERMRKLVHRTIAYREENNIVRRDLLQLLLQLRNTGKVNNDDAVWSAETTAESLKSMSKDNIAAHLFLFFVAGYETSAASASLTLYELAQNPDVLVKLREDINQALERHNGQLTYDCIQDMKYLELCVMETTRKYPGLPLLNRICTKDYPLPDSKLVVKKGTPIIISLLGIHRDKEYFPQPLTYQPERFAEETRNYTPAAYMPFGEGPRHCIAARMGKMNVKLAVAKILTNFNLEARLEKREIEFTVNGVPLLPKGGVPVKLTKKAKCGTA